MAGMRTVAVATKLNTGQPGHPKIAHWLPGVVLIIGFALTGALCAWESHIRRSEARAMRERLVESFGRSLSAQVQSYIDTLPGLRLLGVLKTSPTDAEFQQYVEAISLQRRFPGLALTFVADLVDGDQRSGYLRRVQTDRSLRPQGHPGFDIRPPGDRAQYMVLRHSYPFDAGAFGYDLYDPQQLYRPAVDAAMDSGGYVATGPVLLARDRFEKNAPARTSVVVRAATFDGGLIPTTREARRAAAKGVVGISFSMLRIVKSVLPPELAADAELRITDPVALAAGANSLLFDSRWLSAPASAAVTANGDAIWSSIRIADRTWDIQVTQRAPTRAVDGITAMLGLLGGGLTLALAAMMQALVRARQDAELRVLDGLAALQVERDSLARSEARYRLLFANSMDAVLQTRPDGTVLAANAAACRLFGFVEAELQSRGRSAVVDGDDPRVAAMLEQRHRSGNSQGLCRMRRADGSTFEAEVSTSSYLDGDGRAASSVIVRDVTEREIMAAQRQRLTAMLDATPDFVGSADPQGRNIFLNLAARRMLGRSAHDDVSAITIEECHPPWAARVVVEEGMPAAMRDGSWTGRTAIRAAGAGEFPVSQLILCHRDAAGEITHFSTIARDLRDLEQAQAQRQALERQVFEAQKLESIGTLAGGVAHDFNNVLAAILGNVALVRGELPAEASVQAGLSLIQTAARRARELVKQILTFSRNSPQQRSAISLRAAVEEALALLRSTLPASSVLVAELPEEPLAVMADAGQVQQVVLNLCTNAWQAHGEGTGRILVRLESVSLCASDERPQELPPGRYARLSVTDQGIGMSETTRARIFEPFFTTKPPGQGTGLGLSVVHGIVTGSAGVITVQSEAGVGTRFDVYLPQIDASALLEPAPLLPRPAAAKRARHVLYVDDDEVVTLTISALLQHAGHRVTALGAPEQAIEAVRANRGQFDLVLTDYNMPGMSGLKLAEVLREIAPDLPVVVTSGYMTEELQVQARRSGARAVIAKEFSVERLNDVLAEIFEGSDGTNVTGHAA
jgi:PAS domain S-box-containing protein